jgi:hypothetical protein
MSQDWEELKEECQEELAAMEEYGREIAKAQTEWAAKWPNYCRACDGWGMWHTRQTYWEPADGGPCEELHEEQCHRCGEHHVLIALGNEDIVCIKCGWVCGQDGLPQY